MQGARGWKDRGMTPHSNEATSAPAGARVDDTRAQADSCRQLIRAWDDWRGDELLPRRSDIDLAGIKDLLPGLLLLEARARDRFIFRLVGTLIDEALGVGVTGSNYLDFARPELRELRAERMVRQLAWPCGARMITRFVAVDGDALPLEVVALPMRSDADDRPRLLIAAVGGLDAQMIRDVSSTAPLEGGAEVYEYFDIGAGVPQVPVRAEFLAPR